MFFKKSTPKKYDKEHFTPVLRCSICTGETVAGFMDKKTGKFTEDALIQCNGDLEAFKKKYNIIGQIEKIY